MWSLFSKWWMRRVWVCACVRESVQWGAACTRAQLMHTLARWSSFSVLTPKREMLVLFRLELCISFFTPLIWVMSCCFFFFSLSFWVGDGISTSFCLSVTDRGTCCWAHMCQWADSNIQNNLNHVYWGFNFIQNSCSVTSLDLQMVLWSRGRHMSRSMFLQK